MNMANSIFGYGMSGSSNSLSNYISQSLGGRSSSGMLSDLSGMLGDYASVKNGSYGKLMKAYYNADKPSKTNSVNKTNSTNKTDNANKIDSTNKTNSTNKTGAANKTNNANALGASKTSKAPASAATKKADKTSADTAKKLVDSASAMKKMTYNAGNMDKVADAAEAFVKDYNSALKASKDSDITSVKQNGAWMESGTKANEKMLASVGIKINEDNTLSLDKDALKSANLTTVKNVFSGNSSYMQQVSNRAAKIYAEAASAGTATSSYTDKGSYYQTATGTMLDGFM